MVPPQRPRLAEAPPPAGSRPVPGWGERDLGAESADEATAVSALPLIGDLDRPYRVEIRFRGEISVTGELGELSIQPTEPDSD